MSVIEPPLAVSLSTSDADNELGRSAVRKASWRILPIIGLGYCCAFMDRANISFASLQMNRDLHFTPYIYGLGAGLFFLSYAACELPSNLLLCRFGARRWLARIMFTWGLLAIAMMFVRTPVQFYIARFLLGMAEAGFFPGVVYYIMQWFPPPMRARAVSHFYISLPLSSVVMGALAGALLNLQGRLGLAGWQWLFIIEGLPPILLSVVFWMWLPDTPADAPWLTIGERTWLIDQISADAALGGHCHDIRPALLDRRVWMLSALFLCMLAVSYAYTFSAPDILRNLTGFNITNVGFLVSGMNILAAVGMIANARHSDRRRERYWHVAVPFFVLAACFVIAGSTTTAWIAVPALASTVIVYSALQGPLLSIPATFLKGRSAAAGIATMNSVGILGGFIGPYWMGIARQITGNYQHGLLTLTIPSLMAAALILVMRRDSRAI
jgi:ACS family tartrate transporter-like MFS transporter